MIITRPTPTNAELTPKSDRVVEHLRKLVQSLGLRAGERLPAERELAQKLNVTRGDVRRAIGYLAALGALEVRHGVGAFLAKNSGGLSTAPIEMLRAIGGFETWQMFEARRALETELAGLAAERARAGDLEAIAEELVEMAATLAEPEQFLVHDIRFHRAIAHAAGNPILAALMEGIAGALYRERQSVAGTLANRREALRRHNQIYTAIATRNSSEARRTMQQHLESQRCAEGAA